MKIAYLSYGESAHDIRFLSKIIQSGHKAFLISYYGNKIVNVPGVEVLKYDFKHLSLAARILYNIFGFQLSKKILIPFIASHLKKVLKTINADVMHTNFIHYEGFCGALSGFHPVVSSPWGSDVLINAKKGAFDRFAARYTLKHADHIVCDSMALKEQIIEISGVDPDKIDVFAFGINLRVFKPDDSGKALRIKLGWENNIILMMNRSFKPVYGIKYFLEALPAIVKQYPQVRILLVGDGPEKKEYKSIISSLGLSDKIHMPGFLGEGEMNKYLNAADIYISASLSDSTPVSLLEAFACRLPVIVTDIPSILEWVKDGINGFVVPTKDPGAITKALIKLVGSEALRIDFAGKNIAIAKERADWDKNYALLDSIYHNLARKCT